MHAHGANPADGQARQVIGWTKGVQCHALSPAPYHRTLLRPHRCIATRHEMFAARYFGFLLFATIVDWLKFEVRRHRPRQHG